MPEVSRAQDSVLVVFAKAPIPGKVKTRLATSISAADSAMLYQAFLTDALKQYKAISDVRLYVPESDIDDNFFQTTVSKLHTQKGKDLGSRMQNAIAETFDAGFKRVVIIGTDHPTLPSSYIETAFSELNTADTIVLGPTADGGFYLLGQSGFNPDVFEGMTYSHGAVFDQTVDRAIRSGHQLTVLPEWYDVDDRSSLRRLFSDLERADKGESAEQTRLALIEIDARYPSLFQNKQDE